MLTMNALLRLIGVILVALCLLSSCHAEEQPGLSTLAIDYPGAAKRNQCVFLHKGQLYVFGGTRSLDPRDFEPANFVDDAYRIDTSTGKVTALTKPPMPMMRVNTVVVGDVGYAVGGITHDGKRWQLSDAIWRYDFSADKWTRLQAKLPTARTLFGLTEKDGLLWVLGGWCDDPSRAKAVKGPGMKVTTDVVTIDIRDKTPVVQIQPEKLPHERRSYGAARIGNKFYLSGGLDDGFDYVEKSDVFDLSTRKWEEYPSPNKVRAMADLVACAGKLYLAGGFSFGEVSDDGKPASPFTENRSLEVYDPTSKTWTVLLAELPNTVGGSALNLLADDRHLLTWSFDQKQANRAYLTRIDPSKLTGQKSR